MSLKSLSSIHGPCRGLFENEHTVMLLIDPSDGRLVDANPAAAIFYGWTREKLVGMHMQTTLEIGPSDIHLGIQHRLKDGTLRDVEVHSGPVELADRRLLYAVVHDATGRHRAETHLKLKSKALDMTANSVIITGSDGQIAWANSAFFTLSGYSEEEAVGRTPGELIKSDVQDHAFHERMWETLRAGSVWSGEIVNRMRDGRLVTEDLTITPMLDEHGVISHYVGVKQDISDKKSLEKQYLQSQREESIRTLAGGIAHDLNNALAPILLGIDAMKTGEQDADRLRLLDRMDTSAKRGADLVRQVLEFSRGTERCEVVMNVRHVAAELEARIQDTFPANI